jgi:hypothetical protein
MTDEPQYTCPRCGLVSHHPMDVRHHYCVRCHIFEDDSTPSMDDKDTPSPPSRTTEEYERDKAAGIVRGGHPLYTEDFLKR